MTDVPATTPANRFVPARPTPVWTARIKIHTDFAQRIYKRVWDRLKADLYVLTVRTRSTGMDEAAKVIETTISDEFASARQDLEADLARTEALMDSVKLTDLPTYKNAQDIEVEYSTPRAKEFLNLLQQLDQLLMRYDALWLTGNIETQPRVQRSQNWQRRLVKIANRLRELGNRTRVGITREYEKRVAKTAGAARPTAGSSDAHESSASTESDQPADLGSSSDEPGAITDGRVAAEDMLDVPIHEGDTAHDLAHAGNGSAPIPGSSTAEDDAISAMEAALLEENPQGADAENEADVLTPGRKRRRKASTTVTA